MVAQIINDENGIRTIVFAGSTYIVRGNKNDYEPSYQALILQTYRFLKIVDLEGDLTGHEHTLNDNDEYNNLLLDRAKELLLIGDQALIIWFLYTVSGYEKTWNNDLQALVDIEDW